MIRSKFGILSALTAGFAALTSSPFAEAADAHAPPGSTVCSTVIASSTGMYLWGGSAQTWRNWLLASPTFGGTETNIYEVVTNDVYAHVPAPGPGLYYYRTCATNVSPYKSFVRLRMSPEGGGGPEDPPAPGSAITAVLGPGGTVWGNIELESGLLVGESDVPVRFCVQAFDEDYTLGPSIFESDGTSVSQEITETEFGFMPCVRNISSTPATLSFEFIPY
ncbi:MAG TPA: hypothetical protein VKY73_18385 [Polyangiaceae bacterium]|nr:hypothetical protein [Polyangiaceae bacterium]